MRRGRSMLSMLLKFMPVLWLLAGLGTCVTVHGEASVPPNALSAEAKRLADTLVAAANQGDLPAAVALFQTNCLVTWCNAETSRGHAGLRSFHERLLGGQPRRVEQFQCEITLDDSPMLLADGNTAICSGAFNERFKLTGGRKIDLQGRWTATLVRQESRWLIANLQLTNNTFDNSVLSLAKQASWVVGLVGLLTGAVVGWIVGRKRGFAATTR